MHSLLRDAIGQLCKRAIETEYPKLVLKHAHLLSGKKTWLYFDQGLAANAKYIEQTVPEVLAGGLSVLDVGAGPGHFLLLCRELGCEVAGVDMALSEFDTDRPANAYRALTDHFGLGVEYVGFEPWLEAQPAAETYDLINFRGSMDGVLAMTMDGHKPEVIRGMLDRLRSLLKPGGAIVVSHNIGQQCEDFRAAVQGGVPGFDKLVDMPTLTRLRRVEVAVLPLPEIQVPEIQVPEIQVPVVVTPSDPAQISVEQ